MSVNLQLGSCNIQSGGSTHITTSGEFNTVVINNTIQIPDEAGQLFRRSYRKVYRNRHRLSPSAKSAIALKATIKELNVNLELSAEYDDLRTILDGISNKMTNAVIFFATCGILEADSPFERRINQQIIFMQSVLDDFAQEQKNENPHRQSGFLSTFFYLWDTFRWNYNRARRIIKTNHPLAKSAFTVSMLLQEINAPFFLKEVLSNYVSFVDFFGADFPLPERVCLDQEAFYGVLGLAFKGGPAQAIVATRRFNILVQDKLQTVGSEEWRKVIEEGELLRLCVVVNKTQPRGKYVRCPRCGESCSSLNDTQEWVDCVGCQSSFNVRAPANEMPDGSYAIGSPGTQGTSSTEPDQAMPFKFYSIQMNYSSSSILPREREVAPNNAPLVSQLQEENPVPTLAHTSSGDTAEAANFPSTPLPPQNPVNPVAPPLLAGFPVYSASGFDLLSLLARVVTRPNPQIPLGPVDLTCSFVVVDTRIYDQPIVFCSPSFCRLTGYEKHEILGRNPRFLQAPPGGPVRKGETRRFTSQEPIRQMYKNLSQDKEVQTSIINYRKDGTPFLNFLTIIPLRGGVSGESHEANDCVWHIGFQVDLIEQPGFI